jgi:hypothetical protein
MHEIIPLTKLTGTFLTIYLHFRKILGISSLIFISGKQ